MAWTPVMVGGGSWRRNLEWLLARRTLHPFARGVVGHLHRFAARGVRAFENQRHFDETVPWLNEMNMGATAIGTGITADPRYADAVRRHLVDITGFDMVTAPDLIEATSDAGVFMTLSGILKRAAVKLSKICNDLQAALQRAAGRPRRDQPSRACRPDRRSCPAR